LRQQGHDEVDLVVPGGRHDDVAQVQLRLLQARHLTGVGEYPLGPRHPLRAQPVGGPLDEHHLVAVLDELLGHGAPDVARAGDGNPHAQCTPSGGAAAALTTPATMSSVTSMNTWSPSWIRVDGVGSTPRPKRIRY